MVFPQSLPAAAVIAMSLVILPGCALLDQPDPPAATSDAQVAAIAQAVDVPELDIPYTQYTLDNGLTLIVHEDHKTPVVAVNIWYHVGSKDEPEGRSGFAHLFEHLMFNGSENFTGEFFEPLENVGATKLNGTTNVDRTNYFANVPTPALDMLLWMESDRMGHLLGAIDQAKLDEQRDVVKNEKRQGENRPYGRTWSEIPRNTYPPNHPYAHTVIGSMEDLEAASLDDVKQWFRDYYGPNNAVIVIAGDVTPEHALDRVTHYFGDIPPGPAVEKHTHWPAPMVGEHRQVLRDQVPQAAIVKIWNVPGVATEALRQLSFASSILGSGRNSRLYQRLVAQDQTATSASAGLWPKQLGSQLIMRAIVQPGGDVAAVEAAMDEELARFLAEGPTADEMLRVRTRAAASLVRASERIDGFGGKSDILARSFVYGGSADSYKQSLATLRNASAQSVQATAQEWLTRGVFVQTTLPAAADLRARDTGADRSIMPQPGTLPDLRLPALQRVTLSNGLNVIFAERRSAPLVEMRLVANGGAAAARGSQPPMPLGIADQTFDMVTEGTDSLGSQELSAALERLGAYVSSSAGLRTFRIGLSAITPNLEQSVAIYADVIRNPAFPPDELERVRKQWLAGVEQEKTNPRSLALRVLPPLLYGNDHPLGIPLTGSGTAESIRGVTRAQLQQFYRTWMRPDNATLVVVGDVTLDTLVPLLERHLGDWQAPAAPVPTVQIAAAPRNQGNRVYLLDRKNSEQSLIIGGYLTAPKNEATEPAVDVLSVLLGGSFTSRINMNLREDKGWSYGARGRLSETLAQRPYLIFAPVQTDQTAPAMHEILRELDSIAGDNPPQPAEIERAKNALTQGLPGRNETTAEVIGTFVRQLIEQLPDDYFERYVSRVQATTDADLQDAIDQIVDPSNITWVIVGDLNKIEQDVRDLSLGPVTLLDADGQPIVSTSGTSQDTSQRASQ